MIDFYNTVALWRKLGEGGVPDCLSKFSLVIIFYLHKQHLSRRVTCNICEIHETNSFVVRQGFFFCCNTHAKNCQTIYHSKTCYQKQPTFASNDYFISHFIFFPFFKIKFYWLFSKPNDF